MTSSSTSHVRWFLIFWLFVLSAVAFLDRVNISIAGSSIASEYHLTNVQLGWVFSAFLAGYALFQTLGGMLADRFGPRRVLAAGVVWWGVFTALTASVPHGIQARCFFSSPFVSCLERARPLFILRPTNLSPAGFRRQERGIANGWIFAGVGAGAGLSPPLITFVMLHYGWRASFWVCAVIGLVVGLVWFIAARDNPEEHSGVSPSELALIRSGLPPSADGKVRARRLIPWKTVFKSKEVLAITISYFSFGYVAWIFLQLVLHVSGAGSRIESEVQCSSTPCFLLLRWRFVAPRRRDQRSAHSPVRSQDWALLSRIGGDHARGCISRSGIGSRKRASCQCGTSRWCRRALSCPEFLLVCHSRSGRHILRIGFRLHEYGRPSRRMVHRLAHPADRQPFRLDGVISGSGRAVRDRRDSLALRRPQPDPGSSRCAGRSRNPRAFRTPQIVDCLCRAGALARRC